MASLIFLLSSFPSKTTGATSLPKECFQSQHWSAAELILRQTRDSNDPLEWDAVLGWACARTHRIYPHPQAVGWRLSRGNTLKSGPPAMSHIKARADTDAAMLFALSHLGQHRLIVEQPRLWKLQPYQVSHCLGNLGRPLWPCNLSKSTPSKQVIEMFPGVPVSHHS